MKVLMLAAACSPYQGSEPSVGWLWAKAAASRHEVWLLVSPWCMVPLKRAREEGLIPDNLHIIPVGSPDLRPPRNKFLARLYCWFEYADYQRAVRHKARELTTQIPFDLAHQTSIATWRMGTTLSELDLPYVWGPLGGSEAIPWVLSGGMSLRGYVFEGARVLMGEICRRLPFVRRSACRAAVVIATNADNERMILSLGREGPVIRCPMLIKVEKFQELSAGLREVREVGRPYQLFIGGGLHAAKGVALALRTMRLLLDRGMAVQLVVGGHGSEDAHLHRLAKRWDLAGHVEFKPGLGGAEYLRQILRTDVLLLPTLRDNTALTLVEAMAAGVIAVVLDHSGPGEVVADGCGLKVPVGGMEDTLRSLADAVQKALAGGPEIEAMRERARERIKNFYLEDRAERTLDEVYGLALKAR